MLKSYQNYRNPKQSFFLKNLFFDKLAGSDELRKQIIAGKTEGNQAILATRSSRI
jgi:hypothetical protein